MHLLLLTFGLLECAMGWLQLLGVVPSGNPLYVATGSFYNPGPYCCYLAVILPVGLWHVVEDKDNDKIVMYWLGMVYVVMSVPLMLILMSRTAWIAALSGCLATLLAGNKISLPKGQRLLICMFSGVFIAIMLLLIKVPSAVGRLFIWIIGIKAMIQAPVWGTSWDYVAGALGSAQELYFVNNPDSVFASVAGSPRYAFNEFIQIGIAFGIPAMLAFTGMLIIGTYKALKYKLYPIFGAFIGFSVVCLASYPLQFSEFIIISFLLIICVCLKNRGKNKFFKTSLIVFVSIVGAFSIIGIETRENLTKEWKLEKYKYHYGLSEKRCSETDTLLARYGMVEDFLFDYGKALRENGCLQESDRMFKLGEYVSGDPMFLILRGRNCEMRNDFVNAEIFYRRAIARLPGRLYPHYLLARLYADWPIKDGEKFEEVCSEALELKPKVESSATREMRAKLIELRDSVNSSRSHK